ncbi:pilin [bacterium]|nr:pilin [bacterium]
MKKILIILGALAFPTIVFAQIQGPIGEFLNLLQEILSFLVPLIVLLAIVYFFWGLAKYVLSAGDAEKAAEGKSIMIWGVLALFVMVTVWGIIGFLQQSIPGVDEGALPVEIDLPTVEFPT